MLQTIGENLQWTIDIGYIRLNQTKRQFQRIVHGCCNTNVYVRPPYVIVKKLFINQG